MALGGLAATRYSLFNMAEGGQPDHTVWYDAARKYPVPRFNAAEVDWRDVGVDVLGIGGDLAETAGPLGAPVLFAGEVAELLTVAKSLDELDTGDPSGDLLDTAETVVDGLRLTPSAGVAFDIFSLGLNLGGALRMAP